VSESHDEKRRRLASMELGRDETRNRGERRASSESFHFVGMLIDEVEREVQAGRPLRVVVMGALGRALDYGRELAGAEVLILRQKVQLLEARIERLRDMVRRRDGREEGE
jgi:hypothetical protein